MKRKSSVLPAVLRCVIAGCIVAGSISVTGASAQEGSRWSEAGIDSVVARVMKEFQVPGVSLAVVKEGTTLLAKGYGVKKLGGPDPVDSRTLFGIASNTKAFTATALGILVEEGKLKWDGRVVDYLPWFQLSDPYVTREMTIRDLLVHRSGLGLGAGDLLWWPPTTYDRKEIAKRLRHIPLSTSFRSAYAYDNVLYVVAGEVIEAVSGKTWEDFVTERILRPVGMSTSNVRQTLAEQPGNVAGTHAIVEGTLRAIKPMASDNTNPAGGINSNAEDMAKWMIVQLDSGRLGSAETRLFSSGTARELWKVVTPIPFGSYPPELAPGQPNFNGYALGFNARDYRGLKILTHTGGLPGYVSRVAMVPARKIGVSVLTNQESGAAFDAIVNTVLDILLEAPAWDWTGSYVAVMHRRDSLMRAGDTEREASRTEGTKPSLPVERYAGTYNDVWYGDVVIVMEDGKPVIRFGASPSLVGDLEHWQYDTFIARWRDRELRADAYVTFTLTPEGAIDRAAMKAVSPATDFSFDFQDLVLKPVRSK
jgi:CubicO group peptidase (beta-lactamase class C family)